MGGVSYAALSSELVANEKLELQAGGENVEAFIQALPLRDVRRILDIGSGSGAMSRALARQLGPEVQVFGLDISPEHVHYAEETARRQGLRNAHYIVGDVFDLSRDLLGDFDLVYEKYVLMSMAPRKLGSVFLSCMRDCARKGGKVVCIEADINFGQERFPPPPAALSEVLPNIVRYYRDNGLIEWRCGVQLHHYFRLAGFSDTDIKLVDGRIIAGGFPRQLVEHDNINVEQLIEPCLSAMRISASVAEVARQWREYLASPDSFLYTPVFMGIGTA